MQLLGRAGWVGAEGTLELWGVGLPEGEGFDGVLEVAAEGAVAVAGDQDLADVDAGHEELEVVTVFGEAEAALNEGADFEGEAIGVDMEGGCVAAGDGLRGGYPGGGEQEGKDPDRGCSDALHAFGHSMAPVVWMLTEEGRR